MVHPYIYDESTIRRYTASKVKELEENLLDINRIDSIIKEVYQDKLPEYITLGGNGASIKPVGDSSRSSIYAFEVASRISHETMRCTP